MALIDDLLARTHLQDDPVQPPDVIPYNPNVQHDQHGPHDGRPGDTEPDADPVFHGAGPGSGPGGPDPAAAQDLTTLCESVLAHTGAESLQKEFDTDQIPAAPGARILGCILHIADDTDGARMWWQYAAGADDNIAAFCLYLHHLSLGELHVADRWRRWTTVDTLPSPKPLTPRTDPPQPVATVDVSTPTILRTLRRLADAGHSQLHSRTEFATAVLDYVPNAVAASYISNPDTTMPVPDPHFADRIGTIIAVTTYTAAADMPPPPHRHTPQLDPLPARDTCHLPDSAQKRPGALGHQT